MSGRLLAEHPELAALLDSLDPTRRAALVRQVALVAADRNHLDVPQGTAADLASWAERLDDTGWVTDASGEPTQREDDFYRARAASAVRDAHAASEIESAAADSLYESIAAMGLDRVLALVAELPD